MSNATDQSLNDVIDNLQAALDDARRLPDWSVTLIIIVALLCIIILLHVLAVLTLAPCLWALWTRRRRLARNRLPDDDMIDPDDPDTSPTPDSAVNEHA